MTRSNLIDFGKKRINIEVKLLRQDFYVMEISIVSFKTCIPDL